MGPYIEVVSDATTILRIVRSHSPHDLAVLAGYVLLAWTLDRDGTLRAHTGTPADQDLDLTTKMLSDSRRSLIRDC